MNKTLMKLWLFKIKRQLRKQFKEPISIEFTLDYENDIVTGRVTEKSGEITVKHDKISENANLGEMLMEQVRKEITFDKIDAINMFVDIITSKINGEVFYQNKGEKLKRAFDY